MYYKVTVLVEEDSLKDHLAGEGMSEDELEDMSGEDLQDEARESVNGILSDWFSDYHVLDKNSIIFGVCERVQDKNKWAIPADFTITVFEPNVVDFTEDQIKILLFHELLHVGIEFKDGFETYSCKPHDLEDFKYIIDRFGTNWSEVKANEC